MNRPQTPAPPAPSGAPPTTGTRFTHALADMRRQLRELAANLGQSSAEQEDLIAETLEELAVTAEALHMAREEIEEQAGELDAAVTALDEARATIAALEAERDDLGRQLKEARANVECTATANTEAHRQLSQSHARIDELARVERDLRRELAQRGTQADQARVALERERAARAELEEALREARRPRGLFERLFNR